MASLHFNLESIAFIDATTPAENHSEERQQRLREGLFRGKLDVEIEIKMKVKTNKRRRKYK